MASSNHQQEEHQVLDFNVHGVEFNSSEYVLASFPSKVLVLRASPPQIDLLSLVGLTEPS
tara:strand:- start:21890 stop:22069 length:180 start_codon:yes stop_codon:yes gene_type:complete